MTEEKIILYQKKDAWHFCRHPFSQNHEVTKSLQWHFKYSKYDNAIQ
jgi:hypothetical protein